LGTFNVGGVVSERGFDPSSPARVTALASFPSQATPLGDRLVAPRILQSSMAPIPSGRSQAAGSQLGWARSDPLKSPP